MEEKNPEKFRNTWRWIRVPTCSRGRGEDAGIETMWRKAGASQVEWIMERHRGPGARRYAGPAVQGFTLVELLVVIFVISILMGLLLPSMGQVRARARAAACQARLRQWGLGFKVYLDDNRGIWFGAAGSRIGSFGREPPLPWLERGMPNWRSTMQQIRLVTEQRLKDGPLWRSRVGTVAMCPMTGYGRPIPFRTYGIGMGGRDPNFVDVSYGFNYSLYSANSEYPSFWPYSGPRDVDPLAWRICDAKGASRVPVLGDSYVEQFAEHVDPNQGPPPEQGGNHVQFKLAPWCINRHNGGINMLFMDWSVRKVGLKELWTLKWHRQFNTAGPWTTAGGVQPDAWPVWMRQFKDH
jgi:prepilin-type N-terminal cleavage/methylation domain-containing protein/prepilin-type processing-associated H-X9-DG protein